MFQVPGGKAGAWFVVLIFYAVLAVSFFASALDTPYIMALLGAFRVV